MGDVHCWNNLIVATSEGPLIPTWIRNEDNILDISHNLFCDSARFDLDVDLLNEAVFFDPDLLYSGTSGVDDPVPFRVGNASEAVGAGRWIGGSADRETGSTTTEAGISSGFRCRTLIRPTSGLTMVLSCIVGRAVNGIPGEACVLPFPRTVPETSMGMRWCLHSDLLLLLGGFGGPCD